ncbi:hypothetical protein ABE438_11875, partial [Bosea sp. TWI1241]|uniref:hypothetical protein n=1 Tax=Bosea sp. TWI1241 TaxID=3148904 RepID=UPI003207A838
MTEIAGATTLTPDLCILGAGPGGIAAATMAAAFGVPVVLAEALPPGAAPPQEGTRRLAAG